MPHATPARFIAAHEPTADAAAGPPRPWAPPADALAAELRAQLPPPAPGLRYCVVVPAKDEADCLPATLAALARQRTLAGQPLPPACYEVLVLANNCTDATADVARRAAAALPALRLHVAELQLAGDDAHVGRARQLLMNEACARLAGTAGPDGIIASTDADTEATPTWLAATGAEIAAGADAVGGRILTAAECAAPPSCPVRAQLYHLQRHDTTYRLLCAELEHLLDPTPADPWPRHHQHFGASLALTVRAYRQVGGLPAVRYLEDEALCQLLHQHDLALRHSPQVQVLTSGRSEGRVEVGLSWQLREWQQLAQQQREPLVDNPVQLVRQWQLRRQLRACWAQQPGAETAALLTRLGAPDEQVTTQLRQAATFGAVWAWARAHCPSLAVQPVPLSAALRVLPQLIECSQAAQWRALR